MSLEPNFNTLSLGAYEPMSLQCGHTLSLTQYICFKGDLNFQNLEKKKKKKLRCVTPGHRNVKNIDLIHLHWKFRLLCQKYTMYMMEQYFKPKTKLYLYQIYKN